MTKNIPPTDKEKTIVLGLVSLYPKQRLIDELEDRPIFSDIVKGVFKLVNVDIKKNEKLTEQYLVYAVKNYDDIKNKKYPDNFERAQLYIMGVDVDVTEYLTREYDMAFPVTESNKNNSVEQARREYQDFNLDNIDTIYHTMETTNVKFFDAKESGDIFFNIIH